MRLLQPSHAFTCEARLNILLRGVVVLLATDLPNLLTKFRASGKKTFLLTNSSFYFANSVLCHILGENWQSYVSAPPVLGPPL
jgi:hypothetical protein